MKKKLKKKWRFIAPHIETVVTEIQLVMGNINTSQTQEKAFMTAFVANSQLFHSTKGGENMHTGKHEQNQKEVTEQTIIFCDGIEKCCGADRYCLSTYHILPTGRQVFKHCGCDDFSQS